jgi:glycosyltransferase involved in cell wall biosynthesis
MEVLYILGQSSGGLPHYTAELANAVAERADVTVLKPTETSADDAFGPDVEVREPFAPLGLSLPKLYRRDLDPRAVARGLYSYRRVREIPDLDPDVVHDTSDLFPQVKLFLGRYRVDERTPLVVTRHEVSKRRLSFARLPDLGEELVDLALPDLDVDRTVVHTENQRRALIERGAGPADVSVIPHGAYSLFGDHEDLDDDPEPNTLLFFGHVVPRKGIDTLVRAVPLVAQAVPDVKLLVAGDGRVPDDVASVVEEHPERFELPTEYVPNDEVREFFGRASVVVAPYHEREGGTNGHSGALATAFSFAKPVVTSRAGNFPELVDGSGAGRTVPSGDPERLAETIVSVLRDDAARREMAANSRRLAEELSWDSIAERHLDLYHDITDTPRQPTPRTPPGRTD